VRGVATGHHSRRALCELTQRDDLSRHRAEGPLATTTLLSPSLSPAQTTTDTHCKCSGRLDDSEVARRSIQFSRACALTWVYISYIFRHWTLCNSGLQLNWQFWSILGRGFESRLWHIFCLFFSCLPRRLCRSLDFFRRLVMMTRHRSSTSWWHMRWR
jgi:hypothetical protein